MTKIAAAPGLPAKRAPAHLQGAPFAGRPGLRRLNFISGLSGCAKYAQPD